MTSRSKIIGLTRDIAQAPEGESSAIGLGTVHEHEGPIMAMDEQQEPLFDYAQDVESTGRTRWTAYVVPTLLGIIFLTWTGFFAFTYFEEIRTGLGSVRIIDLIVSWAVPTLLIAVIWLLATRNSRAEATRFGNVAMRLRTESEALEIRMRTVNEEISLAREFLAQNARELETLGRQSSRKLVEAAEQLGAALADSDEKAKTLETVSNAATSNLEQLRKHLPVVTSAAKDVTNQIGSAGTNAHQQVQSLVATLLQVADAGKTARDYIDQLEVRVVEVGRNLGEAVGESAALLEESSINAESRTSGMAELITKVSGKIRESVSAASADVDRIVVVSGSTLDAQLGALRGGIEQLAALSAEEDSRISDIMGRITAHIEESAARIGQVDASATDQTARLAFAVSALGESTKELGSALLSSQATTDELLVRSDKLNMALDDANQKIGETLPESIERMDGQFAESVAKIEAAVGSAKSLDGMSDDILAKLTALEHLVDVQHRNVERLMAEGKDNFSASHEQADALAAALNQTRNLVAEMTEEANNKLVTSLLRVRETTRQAAESSRKIMDEELANVADQLTEQNRKVLADAVDSQIEAINGLVQASVERNFAVSETMTGKITAQLAEIEELTSNLEQRVADTRGGFEGIDDDSFARRMVLLTESLNSTAIDVAKILSNDVTDTAWAAYLKGDRGVFTRRAVRLLDVGEARAIAAHYGEDSEFREHVNRYIHDFEAMMRVLLSTRDGNAIGVTLLSSDVGKLYVALAQAIERLRN